MDLQRLEVFANDPRRTRQDLEQMLENVKGNAEAVKIVNHALLSKFPVHTKTGAGRTPTEAIFNARSETFESGKDAYLWLVDQFQSHRSTALAEFVDLVRGDTADGKGCRFATTPSSLFPTASKRTGDSKYYAQLAQGWYADTNINHDDKFSALLKLSHICHLEYPTDWEFKPVGGTKQLREHQETVVRAREELAKLLRLKREA